MSAIASPVRSLLACMIVASIAALSGCGGGGGITVSSGGGSPPPPPPPPPPPILDPIYLASAASPFAANCDGVANNGDTLYANAEVEPYVVVDPQNPQLLVGLWQEDRWEGGGAHGIISARSLDGGKTWARQAIPFSRCGGGNTVNGGDYPRTSNPWVTVGPVGVYFESAISFSGDLLAANSTSAVLANRSLDRGNTWQNPVTLIRDTGTFFNDRDAITADPNDSDFVYAVWDRLDAAGGGPTMLARSTNGGSSWLPAVPIYDPGPTNQTISNEVVVLPSGPVLDLFVEIDNFSNGSSAAAIGVMRSNDHGATWSAPVKVSNVLSVGTVDPETGRRVRDASIIPQMAVAPSGKLYVVFQDARFSSGLIDAIAMSTSVDGGNSWSAPVRVNSAPGVPAFDPSIHVRADGTIGISYYDFRNDTADPDTLPTILWLSRSDDGTTWRENAIAGPFDLDTAPNSTVAGSPGLFLGDNQGLTTAGNVFTALFTQTNNSANNRTDIFSAPAVSLTTNFNLIARATTTIVQPTRNFAWSQAFAQRVSDNLGDAMERRLPGWHGMVAKWQAKAQAGSRNR